jgi:DNA-binding response OmpR family regulator
MQRRHRILVVDDHPVNLQICEEILNEDYQLMMVSDGESAITAAAEFEPDIILLDVMMPGISGLDVCRELRNSSRPWVKIIMVSARVETQDRIDAYAAGADDYLCKPFDEDELLAKIRVHLRLRHIEEVDSIKQCLLEVMQHGNRTPLTTILMNSDLLLSQDPALPTDQQSRLVRSIRRAACRLYDWMETGEKLVEFKSGHLVQNPERFKIADRVHSVIERLKEKNAIEEQQVTLEVDRNLHVEFTAEHFDLIVEHLVLQAISNRDASESVTLHCCQSFDGRLLLRVEHESSIESQAMPFIFEPFGNPNCRGALKRDQ